MPPAAVPRGGGAPPWWIRVGRRVIPLLPAGRSRAAALVSRRPPPPFVTRMSQAAGGALFWCDLTDVISRDVCLVGAYEPQVTRVVASVLPQCSTVVDVGANWGYFTLMAGRLMRPNGRVLALEPDPRMFALLERNVALNTSSQVETLPVAAGGTPGRQTLEGFDEGAANRGVSRIRAGEQGPTSAPTFSVAAETVDGLIAARGLDAVDLIKVDVEGAEDAVLAGMDRGLSGHRYRRLLIELHPTELAARGISADACCEPLRRAGYRGWAFDHSPAAVRQAAYAPALSPSSLLTASDHVPAGDPWPHMLWLAPGVEMP